VVEAPKEASPAASAVAASARPALRLDGPLEVWVVPQEASQALEAALLLPQFLARAEGLVGSRGVEAVAFEEVLGEVPTAFGTDSRLVERLELLEPLSARRPPAASSKDI